MTVRKALLDMIGFDVSNDLAMHGNIALRWRKLTYDDEGNLLISQYHRAMVEPDQDIDAVIEAVQQDLEAQGFQRMPAWGVAKIKEQTDDLWTPAVKAAHKAKKDAQVPLGGQSASVRAAKR